MPRTDPSPSSDREPELRALALRGDYEGAATLAIETYGPGVLGWLRAISKTPQDADDVFAHVCERLWTSLPTFVWRGSLRTWLYVAGRNAVIDSRRRDAVRHEAPLSQSPALAAAVRSTTAAFLKSGAKTRLQQLRESLDPSDRTLLILRVDRGMSWTEIAEVLDGGEDAVDDSERRRASARVRKRFERIKERLRASWEGDAPQ